MNQDLNIKVLIADDHNLFRFGIIRILRDFKHIYIIGEAENGSELIQKYFELKPDVVLVDIAMPQMSGLDAVAKIKQKDPMAKALFLSMYDSDEYVYKVLKSGGIGLINKNIMEGELIYALKQVSEGKKYFHGNWDDEKLSGLISEFESKKDFIIIKEDEINRREEQILYMLSEGYNSKEIAEKLELSKKTIDFYRSSMMQKFNFKSTSDLIRAAVKYFNSKSAS